MDRWRSCYLWVATWCVFELVIFFLSSAASGIRNRWHTRTCSDVPSGFGRRGGSGEVQLPAEADAERVPRRHSDYAGWAATSTPAAPRPFLSDLIFFFILSFLFLIRGWFPNEEHACGRRKDQPADMGHSGPGAVNQREALKSCGETDRQTAEQCHLISSRFRSIARSYFRKAHGVLLLYDVTSEKSFLSVRAWADQVQVTVKKGHACEPAGRDEPGSFSLWLSAGLHGGQHPHVCCRKQGGPARAASRGQLCQHAAGREAGQGVLRFPLRGKEFERDSLPNRRSCLCSSPAGVRRSVLWNQRQRRNEHRRGRASSGQVGGWSQFGVSRFTYRDDS